MNRTSVLALAMGLLIGASIVYGTSYTELRSQLETLHTSIAALQSHIDQLTHQQYVQVLNLTTLVDAAENHYIEIARQFLDDNNLTYADTPVNSTTVDFIDFALGHKVPNFVYHEMAGVESPDLVGNRLCWIIQTAHYTWKSGHLGGYWFTFWVDVSTGHVIGGTYGAAR
jgi:hypothetical protein